MGLSNKRITFLTVRLNLWLQNRDILAKLLAMWRLISQFLLFFSHSAKLKSNREVCINPETKWLQQYLKNAINK